MVQQLPNSTGATPEGAQPVQPYAEGYPAPDTASVPQVTEPNNGVVQPGEPEEPVEATGVVPEALPINHSQEVEAIPSADSIVELGQTAYPAPSAGELSGSVAPDLHHIEPAKPPLDLGEVARQAEEFKGAPTDIEALVGASLRPDTK